MKKRTRAISLVSRLPEKECSSLLGPCGCWKRAFKNLTNLHLRVKVFAGVIFLVLVTGWVSIAQAQISRIKFETALREQVAFEAKDFSTLNSGEIVLKRLPTKDKKEIAVSGIVKLEKGPELSMALFRESLSQKKNSSLLVSKKFSSPPVAEDLLPFKLEKSDIEDLRNCRIGKCRFKVSAETIGTLQTDLDWEAPDLQGRVNELIRRDLLDFVTDYLTRGDEALLRYTNSKSTISSVEEQRLLLKKSPFVNMVAPEFANYLREFPQADLPGMENSLSWSKISFGLKPFVVITHTAGYDRSRGQSPEFLFATKQLYASRYLDSSLVLAMLVGVATNDSTQDYVIITFVSRSSALGGLFSGIKRSIVGDAAAERVKEVLLRTKASLESIPVATQRTDSASEPHSLLVTLLQYCENWRSLGIFALAVATIFTLIYCLTRIRALLQ